MNFAKICSRQFKTLRSKHRFGYRWNVGNSNGKSYYAARSALLGASSSVVLTGHPTASPESRHEVRPFSLPQTGQGRRGIDNEAIIFDLFLL
jgi:hypothetical protein